MSSQIAPLGHARCSDCRFEISDKVTIYKSRMAANYPFRDFTGDTNAGDKLMNRFSSENFDQFCLAVAFTYRDFGQLMLFRGTLSFHA